MQKPESTSWPPAPAEAVANPLDMRRRSRVAGLISLALALIGVIALVAAYQGFVTVSKSATGYMVNIDPFYCAGGAVAFSLMLQVAITSVVTGLIGIRTFAGKAGLLIGLANTTFAVVVLGFIVLNALTS